MDDAARRAEAIVKDTMLGEQTWNELIDRIAAALRRVEEERESDHRLVARDNEMADLVTAAIDRGLMLERKLADATARLARVEKALRSTNVAQIAESDALDGHDWIERDSVVWCQWCGVHRVEVPDWTDHPQCPAIVATRAALTPDATTEGT